MGKNTQPQQGQEGTQVANDQQSQQQPENKQGQQPEGSTETTKVTPDTTATTKAGQEAKDQQAQRDANAAAAKPAAVETPIVKTSVTKSDSGITMRESKAEVPSTLVDHPAYKEAYKLAKPATKAALGAFLGYLDAMQPAKSQTPITLARHQATFYNTLMSVLIGEDENFATIWKAIVTGVRQNRNTVFALTMCQRGLDSAPSSVLDDNAVHVLARLIQLLRVEAVVGNNAQLHKQIRVSDVTRVLVNMRARDNLTRYYSNQ